MDLLNTFLYLICNFILYLLISTQASLPPELFCSPDSQLEFRVPYYLDPRMYLLAAYHSFRGKVLHLAAL